MDPINKAASRRNVMKAHCYWGAFVVLATLALVAPIGMWLYPFRPTGVTSDEWLQYSGVLMVLLALLAEVPTLLLQNLVGSCVGSVKLQDAEDRYGAWPLRMTLIVIALSSIGTLISSVMG